MAVIRMEAEDFSLQGFVIESGRSPASGEKIIGLYQASGTQGTATSAFTGSDGVYDIVVGYFDENDGRSPVSVTVGGTQYSWVFDQNLGNGGVTSQTRATRTLATGVTLRNGDPITLAGQVDQAEFARFDYIEFVSASGPAPEPSPEPSPEPTPEPSPTPTPEPAISSSPIRYEAEAMTLSGFRVEAQSPASGGQGITLYKGTSTQGTATQVFAGASGTYDVVVGYFDENDGRSPASLTVGGTQYRWTFDENRGNGGVTSQTRTTRTVASGIQINTGDTLTLAGAVDQSEFARFDYIELVPVGGSTPPPSVGSFGLSSASFGVTEGTTTGAAITVVRSGGSDGSASVTLTPSGGTAIAGSDYTSNPLVVTFAAGETSKTVFLPIVDDTTVESAETVNLQLSNPTNGATLGSQTSATLTIADNDTAPAPNPAPTGSPIRYEAEAMTLSGFRTEAQSPASGGQGITLYKGTSTQGTATQVFAGASGTYDVVVGYFDENDGRSPASLTVGGTQYRWTFDENRGNGGVTSQTRTTRTIASAVQINTGDTLTLAGAVDQSEFARFDYIELVPVTPLPPTNITGTSASETLTGNSVSSVIQGLGGNDVLIGKDGNNLLDGGSGVDTASYAWMNNRIEADLAAGSVVRYFSTGDRTHRIMPLGDSNTRGKEWDTAGYRDNLWSFLTAGDRFDVDFVGSQTDGPSTFDRDHEGHGGWRIDQISSSVNGWLDTYKPDTILLMIGTNDVLQDYQLSTAPDRLSQLIDKVTQRLPSANLLVASIPPINRTGDPAQVEAFNATIPGMVSQKAAQGANVTFVDMFSQIQYSDLSFDNLHLSTSGYTKMAEVWRDALLDVKAGRDTLTGVENLVGTAYGDRLLGNASSNRIEGGAGNDWIDGRGGLDTLLGGSGADTFVLRAGSGAEAVLDFEVGSDRLGLGGGLRYDQLAIAPSSSGSGTLIRVYNTDELLATLSGVQSSSLNASSFVIV
ncbi:Calx-beta domain-containing protein [Geitlerinema sp. PCC 7407]|uniref:Calx-beta domain-containing protein n=1 Tax=Geitlerinema sp. PCC 7407 TaxID=1173025 RepID=UPI00029FCBCE|nr:GDSL-type esterase/lipase family protein [Geitlerinema sp. PCC 7407]AFY65136.1 lipolytic protein G-D-S-L family [Geitlerinema sp. PCC 7407]